MIGIIYALLCLVSTTFLLSYRLIAAALKKSGLQGLAHPQDYLQFFCLGKREGHQTSPDTVRDVQARWFA